MPSRTVRVLLLCALLSTVGYGCWCFPSPLCDKVTENSLSGAIFVGRVKEVWPSSKTLAREARSYSLPALRDSILRRWRGVLSKEEVEYIRATEDRWSLELRYGLMQRVRFQGSEALFGPEVREVYTDLSSCGYQFKVGREYLVDSFQDDRYSVTGRYWTGACSRTSLTDSYTAREDLKAMRAFRSGTPFGMRVYGRFAEEHLSEGIRVRLSGPEFDRSVNVGPDGSFSFDGLDAVEYRLHIADRRGTGSRVLKLASLKCFEATPWLSEGAWKILGGPLLSRPTPENPILEVPAPIPPQQPPALPGFLRSLP
jgi:hypothetical protein